MFNNLSCLSSAAINSVVEFNKYRVLCDQLVASR